MRRASVLVTVAMALSLVWATAAGAHLIKEDEGDDIAPNGRGLGERRSHDHPRGAPPKKTVTGAGIDYHGGPLMVAGPNVYLIWYGDWPTTSQAIIADLINGLDGSPWFNIATTYYDASKTHVANQVTLISQVHDNYSRGKSLSDAAITAIVQAQSPTDTNGVYFVLTAQDVNETSGFCTQYCGWHDHATINGRDIKYAFIGNPVRCPRSCTNGTLPPNGDVGADGAASTIAHELVEATTDPDLNAWYDKKGEENADKCAWTFGTTHNNGTGIYNMVLGSRAFLIQQNWVNAGKGYCSVQYP